MRAIRLEVRLKIWLTRLEIWLESSLGAKAAVGRRWFECTPIAHL
jgi:hypothetical protein